MLSALEHQSGNAGDRECGRSSASWAFGVRDFLGSQAEPFNFLACQGGTIFSLREHQLPLLAGTDPAYVTLSIGGALRLESSTFEHADDYACLV